MSTENTRKHDTTYGNGTTPTRKETTPHRLRPRSFQRPRHKQASKQTKQPTKKALRNNLSPARPLLPPLRGTQEKLVRFLSLPPGHRRRRLWQGKFSLRNHAPGFHGVRGKPSGGRRKGASKGARAGARRKQATPPRPTHPPLLLLSV